MSDNVIPVERIERAIYFIRGQKIILDRDLEVLYGVETKRLKEQVRRNIERFPDDFMFVLSDEEFANWRSHFATSSSDRMGLRHAPMASTTFLLLESPKARWLGLYKRTDPANINNQGG